MKKILFDFKTLIYTIKERISYEKEKKYKYIYRPSII